MLHKKNPLVHNFWLYNRKTAEFYKLISNIFISLFNSNSFCNLKFKKHYSKLNAYWHRQNKYKKNYFKNKIYMNP